MQRRAARQSFPFHGVKPVPLVSGYLQRRASYMTRKGRCSTLDLLQNSLSRNRFKELCSSIAFAKPSTADMKLAESIALPIHARYQAQGKAM